MKHELPAPIVGAASETWSEAAPEECEANRQLGEDAEDCMFPSPAEQKSKSPVTIHQYVTRIMGKPSYAGVEGELSNVCIHTDPNDYDTKMPLMFMPFDEHGGRGGHVAGTDLLVFETASGGRCVRIKTSVKDTLVVVIFNSSRQLHGNAGEEETSMAEDMDAGNFSFRIIPFLRKPIVDFINKRKQQEKTRKVPQAFTKLTLPDDDIARHELLHKPLAATEVFQDQDVCTKWPSGTARGMHLATVINALPQEQKIEVKWLDCRTSKLDLGQKMYHRDCLDFDEKSSAPCKCWDSLFQSE